MHDDLEPNWFRPSQFDAPLPRTAMPFPVKDHPRARPDFSCSGPAHVPAPSAAHFLTPFVLIVLVALGVFGGWLFGWPPVPFFN